LGINKAGIKPYKERCSPPSQKIVEQLIKSALSDNNKLTNPATSSGVVVRPMGFLSTVFSTHSSQLSEIFVSALVGVMPACIVFAVMPLDPSSHPICLITASNDAFATYLSNNGL